MKSIVPAGYLLVSALILSLATAPTVVGQSSATGASATTYQLLLFTGTAGYRHDSIPTAVTVITELGKGTVRPAGADAASLRVRWQTTHTDDGALFDQAGYLDRFHAVAFVHTTDKDPPEVGSPFSTTGAENFARYIQNGGNFVGIHSAANVLYGYPWYGRLVGSFFDHHAPLQPARVRPVGQNASFTTVLGDGYSLAAEEIYSFRSDPRLLPSRATVFLTPVNGTYNESATTLPPQGDPHPLGWYREGNLLGDTSDGGIPSSAGVKGGAQEFRSGGAGRSWYTSLGHTNQTWNEATFQAHILGGIDWALAMTSPNARVTEAEATSASSGASASTSVSAGGSTATSRPNSATQLLRSRSSLSVLGLLSAGMLAL